MRLAWSVLGQNPAAGGPTQQDQAISPHRLLSLVVILTFAWGTLS